MADALLSRKQEVDRTLQEKRMQGYRIESQNDTQAVLVMKGRRRFFNLFGGVDERYKLLFDEQGRSTSIRVTP